MINKIKNKLKKIRLRPVAGETLLEAVIAISILFTIIAPASGIYLSSIHTVALNRNDLIAAALAEEGIELIHNIRDTNLIRYAPDAADCWDTKPDPKITLENCAKDENKIIAAADKDVPRFFLMTLNPDTMQGDIVQTKGQVAFANFDHAEYQLFFDKNKLVYFSPPADMDPDVLAKTAAPSIFSRDIVLTHFKNISAIQITSTVRYPQDNTYRAVTRSAIISNQPAL